MSRRQKLIVALWVAAGIPLAVGAVAGLALSFGNVVDVVRPIVGDDLAPVFPLVWDVILFGAALAYLATAYMGKPRQMWRLISQGGVVGTVLVNATAAHDGRTLVVHLTGPIAWAVLVEAGASQLRADYRARNRESLGEAVPLRLWVTAPVESARTWLRIARRVEGEQAAARLEVGVYAAAGEALRLTLPGRGGRRARSILQRQLRAGSLAPEAVLSACGWLDPAEAADPAQRVLRAALGAALGQEPDVVDDQGDDELDARVDALLASAPDPRCEHGNPVGFCPDESHAGPVEVPVTVMSVGPVNAPRPVPEPVRPPAAAAESERPHRVTVRADEDPLLAAAREVAADLDRDGRRLTRQGLLDGLRDRGVPVSTNRGGDLLRQLRGSV